MAHYERRLDLSIAPHEALAIVERQLVASGFKNLRRYENGWVLSADKWFMTQWSATRITVRILQNSAGGSTVHASSAQKAHSLASLATDPKAKAVNKFMDSLAQFANTLGPVSRPAVSALVPATQSGSVSQRLMQLQDLLAQGLIGQEEFDRKREAILGAL